MNDRKQMGRVAFRVEGDYWNAYFAEADTMEGAIFLGSIAMAAVTHPKRGKNHKAAFMRLIKGCVSDLLEQMAGVKPSWKQPVEAPESERET